MNFGVYAAGNVLLLRVHNNMKQSVAASLVVQSSKTNDK